MHLQAQGNGNILPRPVMVCQPGQLLFEQCFIYRIHGTGFHLSILSVKQHQDKFFREIFLMTLIL